MLNTKFLEMGVLVIDKLHMQCTFYKPTNISILHAFDWATKHPVCIEHSYRQWKQWDLVEVNIFF